MDLEHLKKLIDLFETSTLAEIEVEDEAGRIRLTKASAAPQHYMTQAPMAYAPGVAPAAAVAAPAEEAPVKDTIDSPMVGTFYASPSPSDPSFAPPGTKVDANTTVCIIEAMKIMNEVSAGRACVIERVLVENEQPVEFGQPLFEVRYL